MVNNNELIDVKTVNRPNFSERIDNEEWFTFAGIYPPGYHQVLIYDPELNRAFCKDFVVKHNSKDFYYPEYPVTSGNES